MFYDFSRVLKKGGMLYLSYPNFWECAQRWKSNANGQRRFWEATLYGLQRYKSDFHVCAVNPDELSVMLGNCGFGNIEHKPEPKEPYNTITVAKKQAAPLECYEDLVGKDVKKLKVMKA